MRKKYEAWLDEIDGSITFGTVENIQEYRSKGLLNNNAKFLYYVEADTPEEASAVHYIKMGWEPYVPVGNVQDCPNKCGAKYYPQGSGICPNCGPVS